MRSLGLAAAIRSAVFALAGLAAGVAARADWPLVWDFDGRPDKPVAARVGAGGDLWVLSESYAQGAATSHGVLLRIGPDGEILWATAAPELPQPTGLALRAGGRALAIGRSSSTLRVTAFSDSGAVEWSRTRTGVAPELVFTGPRSAPIWDEAAAAWRIPAGLGGDLAVLSFTEDGDPLPDVLWSPPTGTGSVTSILPRPGGGLLISGVVEDDSPPGWWTVAFDAAGTEVWSRFEDGGTPAGAFSGAFLLSADPVRAWADDETGCGLFSLRLWSLDAATGAPLWTATWPPAPGCATFTPDSVTLAGDRIVAAGVGNVPVLAASFDAVTAAFDAATGELAWTRVFAGATTGIRSEVVSVGGTALVATTLFPLPNPGPTPLWLASWDFAGDTCAAPVEIVPARVEASFALSGADGAGWLLVGDGFNFDGATTNDIILQRVADPCGTLFADGFETGDTAIWSLEGSL